MELFISFFISLTIDKFSIHEVKSTYYKMMYYNKLITVMKKIFLLFVLSMSISLAYSQITVTPKYTPMTYDELYAPIRAYEEAIKNFADRLFSDMDYVSEMMSKDIDNTLYYQLKADYENLDRLRIKVRNNGLSNSARTELSNIESQYRREIMEYYERKRR